MAQANTIYKCTGADGGTLISNARVDKSCKAVVTGPDVSMPAPKGKPSGAAANPSPVGFPKVAEDQQKSRDNDRKRILEQELAGEQKSLDQAKKDLDQAKKDLAEQESVRPGDEKNYQRTLDRLQPYKDRVARQKDVVAQHERNIEAISKELGALK